MVSEKHVTFSVLRFAHRAHTSREYTYSFSSITCFISSAVLSFTISMLKIELRVLKEKNSN